MQLDDIVVCVPPLQDFICEHYGEDSSGYSQEIKELMELRQVPTPVLVHQRLSDHATETMNTLGGVSVPTGDAHAQPEPGRPGAADGVLQPAVLPGPALLPPAREPGRALPLVRPRLRQLILLLLWPDGAGVSRRYDSLTGVPSCQRTLAFEKGSVLFNIGALHTQMGARQDRSAPAGIDKAVDAFQRAAGSDPAASRLALPGGAC